MKQRRPRIETAFEIARVFVFGSRWRDCAGWCAGCESYVPMINPLTAAALEKTTIAEVFRRVEKGKLHYLTTAEGGLLICFSSLLDCEEQSKEKTMAAGLVRG